MLVRLSPMNPGMWVKNGSNLERLGIFNEENEGVFLIDPAQIATLGGNKSSVLSEADFLSLRLSPSLDIIAPASNHLNSSWSSNGWTVDDLPTFLGELATWCSNHFEGSSINQDLSDVDIILMQGKVNEDSENTYTVALAYFGNTGLELNAPPSVVRIFAAENGTPPVPYYIYTDGVASPLNTSGLTNILFANKAIMRPNNFFAVGVLTTAQPFDGLGYAVWDGSYEAAPQVIESYGVRYYTTSCAIDSSGNKYIAGVLSWGAVEIIDISAPEQRINIQPPEGKTFSSARLVQRGNSIAALLNTYQQVPYLYYDGVLTQLETNVDGYEIQYYYNIAFDSQDTLVAGVRYTNGQAPNGYQGALLYGNVLTPLSNCEYAGAIKLDGNDVYIGGGTPDYQPAYWKNGTFNTLSVGMGMIKGGVNDIDVRNGVVYVVGYVAPENYSNGRLALWTDEVLTVFFDGQYQNNINPVSLDVDV